MEIALWEVWLSANPYATDEAKRAFLIGRICALGVTASAYIAAMTGAITPIGNPPPQPPPPWQWWPDWVTWFFANPIQPIVPGPIQP